MSETFSLWSYTSAKKPTIVNPLRPKRPSQAPIPKGKSRLDDPDFGKAATGPRRAGDSTEPSRHGTCHVGTLEAVQDAGSAFSRHWSLQLDGEERWRCWGWSRIQFEKLRSGCWGWVDQKSKQATDVRNLRHGRLLIEKAMILCKCDLRFGYFRQFICLRCELDGRYIAMVLRLFFLMLARIWNSSIFIFVTHWGCSISGFNNHGSALSYQIEQKYTIKVADLISNLEVQCMLR
jgi:hypothetical protein